MLRDDLHPSIAVGPIYVYAPGPQPLENFRRGQAERVVVPARYHRQPRPHGFQKYILTGPRRTVVRHFEHVRPQIIAAMGNTQLSEAIGIRHEQSGHVLISDPHYHRMQVQVQPPGMRMPDLRMQHMDFQIF
jgi:hypothetical protein